MPNSFRRQETEVYTLELIDDPEQIPVLFPENSIQEITHVRETTPVREKPTPVLVTLPDKYRDFADVFSETEAEKLPEERPYNCEIVLKDPCERSHHSSRCTTSLNLNLMPSRFTSTICRSP